MRAGPMVLLGVSAAALIGYAVVALGPAAGEDGGSRDEAGAAGERRPGAARRGLSPPPRFVKPMLRPRRERVAEAEPFAPLAPPQPPSTEISADEALTAFEDALAAMDQALAGPKLGRKRKRELYLRATSAFTALSAHLDATDPAQRATLEEAFVHMQTRMKALKLRPPRRHGATLEPAGG